MEQILLKKQLYQKEYVKYLQQLLKNSQISYLSREQYINNNNHTQQNTVHNNINSNNNNTKPLQTTLCQQELPAYLINRYSRQMLLKQIQYSNQIKITRSKVAIIGSGGIGCPVAMYLAAAGIGQIGLFDSDTVQVTNLHRQIGHSTSKVGKKKTSSLKQTLLQINPHIKINEHEFITIGTVKQLADYQLIVDGSDNPQCRYLLNDYLQRYSLLNANKNVLLSGACIGWQAQITCYTRTINKDTQNSDKNASTACYRCIWGNQQKPSGGCAAMGVIGMVPGIVGLILGVQAIKVITQGKSSLQGHLLTYDGRSCTFRKMKLRQSNKQCIGCSHTNNRIDMSTYNYTQHSTCKVDITNLPQVPSISWQQYIPHKNSTILDVRPSAQYNIFHLQNSINIPYEQLINYNQQHLSEKLIKHTTNNDDSKNIYVSCKSGVMSRKATKYLLQHGIEKVINVVGGINKYGDVYDASIPKL